MLFLIIISWEAAAADPTVPPIVGSKEAGSLAEVTGNQDPIAMPPLRRIISTGLERIVTDIQTAKGKLVAGGNQVVEGSHPEKDNWAAEDSQAAEDSLTVEGSILGIMEGRVAGHMDSQSQRATDWVQDSEQREAALAC